MGPRDDFQSSRGPHYAAQADRFLQVPMEPSDVCLSLSEWLHEWPKQTGMFDRMASPPGGGGVLLSVTQNPGIRVRGKEACLSIRKPALFCLDFTCYLQKFFFGQALIAIISYFQS